MKGLSLKQQQHGRWRRCGVLPLHHTAAHWWNKGCHFLNPIRWVLLFSEEQSTLWITLFHCYPLCLTWEVITKWTNGLAKHTSLLRQYSGGLQCLKHAQFIVELHLKHQYSCFIVLNSFIHHCLSRWTEGAAFNRQLHHAYKNWSRQHLYGEM